MDVYEGRRPEASIIHDSFKRDFIILMTIFVQQPPLLSFNIKMDFSPFVHGKPPKEDEVLPLMSVDVNVM